MNVISENQITLKLQQQDGDQRRVKYALSDKPYKGLIALIHSTFPELNQLNHITVKFLDDEDELCTISSKEELVEAINVNRMMKRPNLKLVLFPSPNPEVKIEQAAPQVSKNQEAKVEANVDGNVAFEANKAFTKAETKEEKEAKSDGPQEPKKQLGKQEQLALAIDFFQTKDIVTALPELVRLFAQDIVHVTDEKAAHAFVDKLVSHSAAIKSHELTQTMLPRIRPKLVKKIPKMAAHSAIINEQVANLLAILPQVLESLPIVLTQVLASLKEGGECAREACAPFLQLLPLVSPIMWNFKRSMRSRMRCGGQLPSRSNADDAASATGHTGIHCDGCGQTPIEGVRFKCAVCPDYDLCATCEAKEIHPPHHPLIKMRVPPRSDVHCGVACDGCGVHPITGPRFKCTECPNFDLCSACESKGEHPAHHPLIKMRLAERGSGPFRGRHHHRHPHGRRGPFGHPGQRGSGIGGTRGGRHGHGHGRGPRGCRRGPDQAPHLRHFLRKLGRMYQCQPHDSQKQEEKEMQHQKQHQKQPVQLKSTETKSADILQPAHASAPPPSATVSAVPVSPMPAASPAPSPTSLSPSSPSPTLTPTPTPTPTPTTGPYAAQLHALNSMGFNNSALNLTTLRRYRGDIARACDWLLTH